MASGFSLDGIGLSQPHLLFKAGARSLRTFCPNIMKLFVLVGLVFALGLAGAEDAKEEKSDKPCNKENCPWPLWNHYEAKGCTPIFDKDACCPTSFNCSKFETTDIEVGCQFKGQLYHQGDKINTTNPCHGCLCGAFGVSSCAVHECFTEVSQPRCIPLFDHRHCCPVNYYCLAAGRNSLEDVKDVTTCKWEGKTYVEGQIIEIKNNPCLTCICKKDFNGPESSSCKKVECSFPGNNLKMKRGCVPVYLKHRCCSVDWICPPPEEPEQPSEKSIEGGCKFGRRHFPKDAELELRDPCTVCKCTTPPDFTCVRTQCDGPPNGDFANCRPMRREGQCCPDFQCFPPGSIPPEGPFPEQGGPPQRPPNQQPQQQSPNQGASHQVPQQ